MLLSEKFKFGKYKGQTLQQVLDCEAGVDWLWWYVEQPCTNSKFASYDQTRKDAIRRKLNELMRGTVSQTDTAGIALILAKIEKIEQMLESVMEYIGKDNVPVKQVDEEVAEDWEE